MNKNATKFKLYYLLLTYSRVDKNTHHLSEQLHLSFHCLLNTSVPNVSEPYGGH